MSLYAIVVGVVGVGTAVLVVISYYSDYTLSYGWCKQDELVLSALKGKLAAWWRCDAAGVDGGWHWASQKANAYSLEEQFEETRSGFALEKRTYHRRIGPDIVVRKALAPLHALAGALLVAAALLGGGLRAALRRRWRLANHMCVACGYDLAGNESGTCPECGTAVPSASRTQTVEPR